MNVALEGCSVENVSVVGPFDLHLIGFAVAAMMIAEWEAVMKLHVIEMAAIGAVFVIVSSKMSRAVPLSVMFVLVGVLAFVFELVLVNVAALVVPLSIVANFVVVVQIDLTMFVGAALVTIQK
jgi:hypothetical protein